MRGEMRILKSGMATSIQDFGRVGFAKYGIPRSGVMDQKAFVLANALLGNTPNSSVLEWTMIPPKLHFDVSVNIACTGAKVIPIIDGIEQKMNRQIKLPANAILSFKFVGKGVFGYVAIEGGFDVEKVFDSASMFAPVTKNSTLRAGDLLGYTNREESLKQHAHIRWSNSYLDCSVLRVFPGPEFELLPEDGKRFLLEKEFVVSGIRSRMGIQLVEPLSYSVSEILTGPVLPGTVQLTPSGRLIILMRDCQTTGGYPRVLQLDDLSLSVLAQKQTREKIDFRLI